MTDDSDPRVILRDYLLSLICKCGSFRCASGRMALSDLSDPILEICPEVDWSNLQAINHLLRCRIAFVASEIQLFLLQPGEEKYTGAFQYEDPDVIQQLFQTLERFGFTGISRAEHIDNGPKSSGKSSERATFRTLLTRFRDR